MPNLISDPWIPVRTRTGERRIIRPDQIADPDVLFPDWFRPDLNLACLEMLIGLVFAACPPADAIAWRKGRVADPHYLQENLARLAPAFNLGGDGPRFLQDLEAFETGSDASSVDMLFIDSAGGQTARNNADLMVHRDRYAGLDPETAAMALYTLQAFAPSGGAGNRTSMRGGGPLTTLVIPAPDCSLYDIVWANVPHGMPAALDEFPWMRPTRVSDKGLEVHPPGDGVAIEAFFGMPRRLRLQFDKEGRVTGVVQRPYGANYRLWVHPLTPYYQVKAGTEKLPMHPRAGLFGYRNWLGIIYKDQSDNESRKDTDTRRFRADIIDVYSQRARSPENLQILAGGWAMDNMKPRDFLWSTQPLLTLDEDQTNLLRAMIQAADLFASGFRARIKDIIGDKSALDAVLESFFQQSAEDFFDRLTALQQGTEDWERIARRWVADLKQVALRLYDEIALDGLNQRDIKVIEKIVTGRNILLATFTGHGKMTGEAAFTRLGLPLPAKKGKKP